MNFTCWGWETKYYHWAYNRENYVVFYDICNARSHSSFLGSVVAYVRPGLVGGNECGFCPSPHQVRRGKVRRLSSVQEVYSISLWLYFLIHSSLLIYAQTLSSGHWCHKAVFLWSFFLASPEVRWGTRLYLAGICHLFFLVFRKLLKKTWNNEQCIYSAPLQAKAVWISVFL